MNRNTFHAIILALAALFTAIFAVVVVPPLLTEPDVIGAFAAGFVNPYTSGSFSDVLVCWLILATWVFFERKTLGVRRGGLGVVPGVAVGFALYLVLRGRQLGASTAA